MFSSRAFFATAGQRIKSPIELVVGLYRATGLESRRAFGLSVAIPTLLAGNVLASMGESIKNTLERGALALLNALEIGGDDGERTATPEQLERTA